MNFETKNFEQFKGIVTAIADPPVNTFEELINYRNDEILGGLAPRYGFKNLRDLTAQPDAFGFTKMVDVSDTFVMSVGGDIQTDPIISGDSVLTGLKSLSAQYTDTVSGTPSGRNVTLTTNNPAWSLLYNIVYNTTYGDYYVVVGYTGAVITLSKDLPVNWGNGQGLRFFRSDILHLDGSNLPVGGISLSTISGSSPKFDIIDGFNNLVLVGQKELYSGQSLWIGRIGTNSVSRKYFGSAFSYNGIYVTGVVEDFTRGAFKSGNDHIQLKKITGTSTQYYLDPNSEAGTRVGTWKDQAGGGITAGTIWNYVRDVTHAPNNSVYCYAANVNDLFTVEFDQLSTSNQADQNGQILVTVNAAIDAGIGKVTSFLVVVSEETSTGVFTPRLVAPGTWTSSSFNAFLFYVPVSAFTNLNKIAVSIVITLVNVGSILKVSYIDLNIPLSQQSKLPIDNSEKNPEYGINLTAVLDGFNETPMMNTIPGVAPPTESTVAYVSTTKIKVGQGTTSNYIGVRIFTQFGELINRRITSLRIYGGVYTAGSYVWRYCEDVALDNPGWTYASGSYYIDVVIGNEVNTGQIYEDRLNRSSISTLIKSFASFTRALGRSFVVDENNRQLVYYSGITANGNESSIVPDSNFFAPNDTIGDILLIQLVGTKIFIFKKTSLLSVDASTASSTPRLVVISKEKGLSSLTGVVSDQRVLWFVTYDGIYMSDGFKIEIANVAWFNIYRLYSLAAIQSAICFYDTYSDSAYFFFRDDTTSVFDLWAFDTKTQQWRKEDFTYTNGVQNYGAIKYVCRTLDNRIVFADDLVRTTSNYMQLYIFPRIDPPYNPPTKSAYTNLIKVAGAAKEIGTRLRFKTNPLDDSRGIIEAYYIDGGYIKANKKIGEHVLFASTDENAAEATIYNLSIYDGSTLIKSFPMTLGREESIVRVRQPLSRFAVYLEVFVRDLFIVKKFGLYYKQFRKAGSVKQQG